MPSEPVFDNVSSLKVQACFRAALARFPELHENTIRLEQRKIKGFTMRAQPVLNSGIFWRKRRVYRVQMSNHSKIMQHIRLEGLPEEVLTGWLAHELGHVVDYHRRTFFGLLWFIIGYVLFATHRAGAERRADLFALEKGFGTQLMATKLYILEQSDLPDRYKQRIRKYYLSPDELELLLHEQEPDRVHF